MTLVALVLVGLIGGWCALVWLALLYARQERRELHAQKPVYRPGDRYTAPADLVRIPTQEATDVLYDTSPRHLAQLFGQRTITLIRTGAPLGLIKQSARLAASYAFKVDPALRRQDGTRPAVVVSILQTLRKTPSLKESVH